MQYRSIELEYMWMHLRLWPMKTTRKLHCKAWISIPMMEQEESYPLAPMIIGYLMPPTALASPIRPSTQPAPPAAHPSPPPDSCASPSMKCSAAIPLRVGRLAISPIDTSSNGSAKEIRKRTIRSCSMLIHWSITVIRESTSTKTWRISWARSSIKIMPSIRR